jgi:hypothetical protein
MNACWPELGKQGYTSDAIRHDLADLTAFHNAFPVYVAQGKDALDTLLTKPVEAAPTPDVTKLTHSQTPVLTRGQATQGTGAQGAVVPSTNGLAPPDALCSIQPGVPQGFSR